MRAVAPLLGRLLLPHAVLLACGDSSSSDSTQGGAGEGGSPTTNSGGSTSSGLPLGEPVDGEYHLGPVEWEGSFNNACSPYPAEIQAIEGGLLAGLSLDYAGDGSLCDACIEVTTALGHVAVLRVVTYGVTEAPGNIDVSQAAFDLLTEGEFPRTMSWRLAECPETGPLYFQWQTEANEYWTSLWVRNAQVPIEKLEVQSANHASFTALERGADGTFTDASGFGAGPFTLRVTGIDGSTFEQSFDAFVPGALDEGEGNL